MKPTFRKAAVAMAVAGTVGIALVPQVEANVLNFSWTGAFTMLNPAGQAVRNSPTDYANGYYANGDGSTSSYGAPYFPANVGPDADCTTLAPTCLTAYGWYGARTPVSGTMSFDTATGAGVGTLNPFMFFGDTPGSGAATSVASAPLGVTFQVIDTVGTMIGSMVFDWNGLGHSLSIVLDASGLFASLPAMLASGPTSTVSGVGALPATNGTDFDATKNVQTYPLGPSPVATKTLNTGGGDACDGLTLATQVNAWTIVTNTANVATCTTGMTDDGIGGDPWDSVSADGFNPNFDFTSVHYDVVPVPPAMWLFGSGLVSLAAVARRKRRG